MTELVNLVIGGLVSGGLYAMLAAGVVLTYQTSGIFNFAHGAVAFATAFLFTQLHAGAGWSIAVSALLAIGVFAPALGLVLDRLIYRRLTDAPIATRVVVPIGLLVAIPAACLLVVDRVNAWFDPNLPLLDDLLFVPGLGPSPKTTWRVEAFGGRVLVDSDQLIVFGVAAATAVVLGFILVRTRIGLELRAVVDRRDLAALRGIDTEKTSAVAWVLACVLAGLAGVLLAPLFSLNPPSFTTVVLISTPAVVFARFRSLPLAFAGGLLVGVVQNLVVGYADFAREITGFRSAVPFLLLFALLFVVRIDRGRAAGVPVSGSIRGIDAAPRGGDEGVALRSATAWVLASLLLAGYIGFVADSYWVSLIARGLALGVVFLSFTVVTGFGGMVSLAQASFVTAAAITAGWALSHGWPFGLAVLAGTLVACLLGIVVSLPARRLGGVPLALATLALAYVAENLVFQVDRIGRLSRGGWEVDAPAIGSFDLGDPRTAALSWLVAVGLVALLVVNLGRSSSGRAMAALRWSEPAAATAGVAPGPTKLAVFAVSAAIAGFGGVLLAATNGRVTRTDFPVEVGLVWLAAAVTFGVRQPAGAVLAGLAVALSPELLSRLSEAPYLPQIMFGLAAVGLAHRPDGLLAFVADVAPSRSLSSGPADHGAFRAGLPRPSEAGAVRLQAQPVRTRARSRHRAKAAAPGSVLVVRGIHAGYGPAGRDFVEALHGVDLVVPPARVVALVGPNGAGKTTLCHVIAGLLSPTRGSLVLGPVGDQRHEPGAGRGLDLLALATHRRARAGVFLVPEGRGIFPALSVAENLAVWLRDPAEQAAALERFPLLVARRNIPAGSLSGGEQQLLALAPALVRPPRLLVVDEPSLGLAPLLVADLYAALKELRDQGAAVLVVEEKTAHALRIADEVAFMHAGRVAWVRPRDAVDEELLARSYLGL